MSSYKQLQKYVSEYFKDKSKDDLSKELFPYHPELFNEIAKYRKYGMPSRYKKAVKKYPVDKHTFFFESNLAKQYTGNPRYIYERMIELYPDYTYIWSYNGNETIPGNPIIVERSSDDYYKYLAKSKFLINNTTFPVFYPRKESIYIQTWHGTPYKQLHWDRELTPIEKKSSPDFYAKSTSWNLLLSPNHYSTEKFRSAFKYEGEILESSYPANDIFYSKDKYNQKRQEIRNKLNIDDNSTVYLYAPTWRDGGHIGNMMFKFNLLLDPEKFLQNAPQNSTLLIRSHHMSSSDNELSSLPSNVIDVSHYDDATELMCASDVLITDYSSIVFDWYCSKKPVIYYVPDYDAYLHKLRGVYFNLEEHKAGIICKSEEELYNNLDTSNTPFYSDFYTEFCSLHDGHASDKVINYMISQNKTTPKSHLDKFLRKTYKKIF